jgi:hypothetical protein
LESQLEAAVRAVSLPDEELKRSEQGEYAEF